MLAESQNVEALTSRNPSLSNAMSLAGRNRRYRRSRTSASIAVDESYFPKDAPHCETCLCLPNRVKCSNRRRSCGRFRDPSSMRSDQDCQVEKLLMKVSDSQLNINKRRPGCNSAVDKLLREMELNASMLWGEKTVAGGRQNPNEPRDYLINQVKQSEETNAKMNFQHRCHHQPLSETSDHINLMHRKSELLKISADCKKTDEDECLVSQQGQIIIPMVNNIESDNEIADRIKNAQTKWVPIDQQSSVALFSAGDIEDFNVEEQQSTSSIIGQNHMDDLDDSIREFNINDAHVRELKLVRLEFIERIYEEVRRLQRLQRHLDDCSPHRQVASTRSISTMTSNYEEKLKLDS